MIWCIAARRYAQAAMKSLRATTRCSPVLALCNGVCCLKSSKTVSVHCGNNELRAGAAAILAGRQHPPRHIAIIGGGFAGVATAWHLLSHAYVARPLHIELFDAAGLGAGGSGAAAGMLHPYTLRGKVLWKGHEAMRAAVELVHAAEAATPDSQFCERQSFLRVAYSEKQARDFARAASQSEGGATSTPTCATSLTCLDAAAATSLLPGVCLPGSAAATGTAPAALLVQGGMVLDSVAYLRALWRAGQLRVAGTNSRLEAVQAAVASLDELDRFEAVIVAAGAAIGTIKPLENVLPLELCQGYTIHLQPSDDSTDYPEDAPSLLGSTYLARRSARHLVVGATKRFGLTAAQALAECGAGSTTSVREAASWQEATASLLPRVRSAGLRVLPGLGAGLGPAFAAVMVMLPLARSRGALASVLGSAKVQRASRM